MFFAIFLYSRYDKIDDNIKKYQKGVHMKVGIIGAGGIARKMARTLVAMESAMPYAVASRSIEKAETFKEEFGFAKAYGSYEAMLSDPEVELVYIATPHSLHYEHALLSLNHNKSILVEKPFMVNTWQAKEVIELGRGKGLLVAEAIWIRYMPSRYLIQDLLREGIIGKVQSLTCNLGYLIHDVPRLKEPELAGGALLDLGVYTMNFTAMVLGDQVKKVTSTAVLTDKGVDAQNSITITFESGQLAMLHSTMLANTDSRGIIYGSQGTIVTQKLDNCEAITVYDNEGNVVREVEIPEQITGFEYQVEACRKAIAAGEVEVAEMPHAEIVRILTLMDGCRQEWNVTYPFDDKSFYK